ncbi:hypothetical protein [Marinobacterium sp. xm-v-233]|nr:hypothetical protein [Marinobacterium sp. xm-v-233]
MSTWRESIERKLKAGDRLKPVTECAIYNLSVSGFSLTRLYRRFSRA